MARVIYSGAALTDLEHLTDFLLESDPATAGETVELIVQAVEVLEDHPLIGRVVEHGLRELVISRGRTGYIALYGFEAADDTILILSVRHQREAGYSEEPES